MNETKIVTERVIGIGALILAVAAPLVFNAYALRYVPDGQLTAEVPVKLDHEGRHAALRASERNPEHTAGHAATLCRIVQSLSVVGSQGSKYARSASRVRLHCAPSRIRTGRNRITPAETRSGPTAIGQPGCRKLERKGFTRTRLSRAGPGMRRRRSHRCGSAPPRFWR